MVVPDAVRSARDRILSHPLFSGSARLSGFCRYIVEETLEGRAGLIKEFTIGVVVYGRGPGFDPKIDSIVRVEASRMRAKLRQYYGGDGSGDPVRIELPPGTYVPVFSNEGDQEATPEAGVPGTVLPAPIATGTNFSRRWMGIALATALAAWAGYKVMQSEADTAFSVAVMPFANLTGDRALDDYAAAFGEQTAVQLSVDPGVRVARALPVRTAGSASGVTTRVKAAALLNGSIQSGEGEYRLVVHLDDAQSRRQLWSATLHSGKLSAMQFQDKASELIGRTLNRCFGGRSLAEFEKRSRQDPVSEELFVRGHQEWLTQGKHGIENAIGLFQQAVTRDPKFADAWAELGAATLFMAYLDSAAKDRWLHEAEAALEKALALDNRNAEAHARLGNIYLGQHRDFSAAERELRLAVELNPGSDAPTRWFAMAACLRRRPDRARRELQFGLMMNPASEALLAEMALLEFNDGRFEEAAGLARRSLAAVGNYAPAHFLLGMIRQREGDLKGAREEFRACSNESGWPFDCRATLALLDATSANPYSEFVSQFPRHYSRALLRLASKQPDLAGKEIESGFDASELYIEYACLDPRFSGLLKDAQLPACNESTARRNRDTSSARRD